MPAVFLTIDTEFAWRHHVAGHGAGEIYARSVEPAGVGIAYQLAVLARHDLKATFFVDPMPALVYGIEWIARIVQPILDAGQEVQLHCHPHWTGAVAGDRGKRHGLFEMSELSAERQREVLAQAAALLMEAGAPRAVAFRGGSYAANDDTLVALAALGITYDSSHNGAHHPFPSAIGLAPEQVTPIVRRGVIEVPVTVIEDRPGALRTFQICALSQHEMRAALDHAIAADHAAVTIVGHSFELANRAGVAPNRTHVRRFDALCAMLAERRDFAPTTHFVDRPRLRLGREDRPLPPAPLRLRWRQAEQLWSTLVSERAA